jgi:hypothetical protein
MSAIFKKLNLKDQTEIVILNAPESFEPELQALEGVKIMRDEEAVSEIHYSLAFVIQQAELDRISKALASKAVGDALLWFAYPKVSSKRYQCEFNRDTGWDVLQRAGFRPIRQVAIDEDWSALRFRRTEFVKARK